MSVNIVGSLCLSFLFNLGMSKSMAGISNLLRLKFPFTCPLTREPSESLSASAFFFYNDIFITFQFLWVGYFFGERKCNYQDVAHCKSGCKLISCLKLV